MHIELVALIVEDYVDAIRFFVDGLGFELSEDSPSKTQRWSSEVLGGRQATRSSCRFAAGTGRWRSTN